MNKTIVPAATLLLLASCSNAPVEQPKNAKSGLKLYQNFTLIDGTGRDAVPSAAILIENGRVKYAGPKSGLPPAEGAEVIDAAGKFVMPGIINLHTHLGNTKGLVNSPKNYTRENLLAHLQLLANYGVTAAVTMGSDQDVVLDVRKEQRETGMPSVARLFTAYKGFTGVDGYPTTAPGMKGVPFEVSTKEQVEKDVKELAEKKVDLVKIWVDDHLGKERKIPLDLSIAIIENAHKYNLKVGAHVFYLQDAKDLVKAGLDTLLHSVRDKPVDKEFLDLMKEKGAWQGASTITREVSSYIYAKPAPFLTDPFFTKSVTPETIAALSDPAYQKKVAATHDAQVFPGFAKTAQKNLKAIVDAGVKYGFGSDSGGAPTRFFGYFEHWEMELMAEAGLTPMQIITAFSKNNAEFLGVSKDLGTIEAGHWADFIVLSKNPLDDIKNSRTIEQVLIAGKKVNQ